MDFNLEKETVMLKSSAEKYLKEKCPPSVVKELIQSEDGYSEKMWKEIAELGWLGLIYPEALGGFGMKFFDLFALMEELGKTNFPSPFFTSAVVSGLVIDKAGSQAQKEQYLPSLINGEKIFTTALLDEKGRLDIYTPTLTARSADGADITVDGIRFLVPYAQVADYLLVVAQLDSTEGESPVILIIPSDTAGLEMTFIDTITEEKQYRVTFNGVNVPKENILGNIGETQSCLDEVIARATVLKCGEMLGGLDTVLKLTVEHVKTRHQFGKPLGALQAVQHHCADLATLLETTRLITSQTAYLISEGLPCEKEIAMAKAWSSDAYKKGTWIAQQLHGGVGFTEEYDLHLFYKHAKASELSFQDAFFYRSRVADQLGI
jgi:3-oxocholest-4-en-26-oyl-CoA dehydrogenase beta subunit